MRRVLFLLFPILLLANDPDPTHLNLFYDIAVEETHNSMKGTVTPLRQSEFYSQHFVLWDFSEDAPATQSYQVYYTQLYAFAVAEGISKVILFPKDPDASANDFFKIVNQNTTDPDCFAYWINRFSQAGIKVEILFEFDAFNNSAPYSPVYSLPDGFYFVDLPQKMNWLKSLVQIVPGAILGVTVDPEAAGSGGNDGYQQVINYIDQYRFDNGLPDFQSAMTFGIDAKPMTFANLDTFPTDPLYVSPPPSSYFPLSLPSYRTVGNDVPLLNNVYLQAYEPDFTLVFTENLAPTTAANTFISALQDIPYKPSYGTVTTTAMTPPGIYTDGGQFVSTGTITCTMGSPNCSYNGSNFATEIVHGAYLDYDQNGTIVPIGQVAANPNPVAKTFTLVDTTNGANVTVADETFILSQFANEIINGGIINTPANYPGHPNAKIAAIDGPIPFGQPNYSPSEHRFTVLSGPDYTLTNQSFVGSEVVMKWIYPPITPAIAAGINFLFSVQYDATAGGNLFFGNWTLDNYMAFVKHFLSQVYGTTPLNPIFTDVGSNGVGLPPTNIGIYEYHFLLLTNANPAQNTTPPAAPNPPPSPANPWFPEFPAP